LKSLREGVDKTKGKRRKVLTGVSIVTLSEYGEEYFQYARE